MNPTEPCASDPKQFLDYFDRTISYPHPPRDFRAGVLLAALPVGFLDGWLNYTEIQTAFVQVFAVPNPNLSERLERFITAPAAHTRIRELQETVHILARDPEDGAWWYFKYSSDTSNCDIGFFYTPDAPVTVLMAWDLQLQDLEGIALPKECFSGWISY